MLEKTRRWLKDYFENNVLFLSIIIEEQQLCNVKINKLLQNASKSRSCIGRSRSEFIISIKDNSSLIIVIECKTDLLKHESVNRDKYSDYAIDWVLLCSAFLSINRLTNRRFNRWYISKWTKTENQVCGSF